MKSIQESKSKLKEKLKRMRYGDREYLSTESSLSYKQKVNHY
jgi:retron-type reverse transcriptase